MKFSKQEKIMYWKKVDTQVIQSTYHLISLNITTLLHLLIMKTVCHMSNISGVRYVTIDRMKFLLYKSVVMSDLVDLLEEHKPNYECMLSNLLLLEADANKEEQRKNNKFKRVVGNMRR